MGGDTADTAGAEGDSAAVDAARADTAGIIRLLLTLREQPV